MGQAKKELEDHEAKIEEARMYCKNLGAIKECDIHEGEYRDTLQYTKYEELTDDILTHYPDAIETFSDRDDLVECVTDVMTTTGDDDCGYCARYKEDD
ncbi:hypothetical protein [Geomonas ferrireducens]|uniref:hypothetical protein n=1 Tax=Geomonas ferrireducens TaxID=2570227 RepID=UPI0010A7ECCE|nr:hypothetical protein [Geomonas ferrireducens]